MQTLTAHPARRPLSGTVTAPGDKSFSHRSLILGALAEGRTEITGLLEGADIMATAAAMRAFGAEVTRHGAGHWTVIGRGRAGLAEPDMVVDFGNAGTGVRLTMGAAAAFPVAVAYTGDASLRGRPMARVLDPLARMGARVLAREGARLPAMVRGGGLVGIEHVSTTGSAQVKSAILLAGLGAQGRTAVIEAAPSRDHTENMLAAFGVTVARRARPEGLEVAVEGGARLTGARIETPGDPSSAAFLMVAALVVPGSDVVVRNVLMNPLRTGLLQTLREMGADITAVDQGLRAGEPVADLRVRHSALRGVAVPPARAPSMIDEYPILAIAAAFAEGETMMEGIGEMRVKESDRIALTLAGLRACGVEATDGPESLRVQGRGARGVEGGARVATHGDHRIAMSFLVLGCAARQAVIADEADMIATSYPTFAADMATLGAHVE
jgi:3-phosphoshikimate 1-carboxyvinyltransferase